MSSSISTKQVAIVTGGAGGMGLGVVEDLVKRGWNVTVVDMNVKLGTAVQERLGEQILFIKANVIKWDDQVEAFVKTWEKWGRLDFVFGNAGIGDRIDFASPVESLSNGAPPKPDTMVVDICLYGVIYSAYLGLHYFRKNADKNGKLAFTSSMCGLYGQENICGYVAAKHGVVGFTRSLAKTLKMRGQPITVNCICPGLVPTPLVSATMVENFPQEKLTPVSTIVKAISGFLDDDSVTGQVAECSSGNVIYREEQAFGDQDAEYLMSGRFLGEMSKKVDLAEVMKDAKNKIVEQHQLFD